MNSIKNLDYSKLVPTKEAARLHFESRNMILVDYQNDKDYPRVQAIVQLQDETLALYTWDRWHGGGGWIKNG